MAIAFNRARRPAMLLVNLIRLAFFPIELFFATYVISTDDQLAKGMSKALRSALASGSVLAVVTTTTSIPRVASTRS